MAEYVPPDRGVRCGECGQYPLKAEEIERVSTTTGSRVQHKDCPARKGR